jgi:hypothetical protein
MTLGRVAGGYTSASDDPRLLRMRGPRPTIEGDPRASRCLCKDHIFGDLRDPETRLIKALCRQAKPGKKALEARARRDQEYCEAIEKAGLDIGRPPLGKSVRGPTARVGAVRYVRTHPSRPEWSNAARRNT